MRQTDIDAVVSIARLAFPDHFENRSCFAERLSLYSRGCFVLDDDAGVCGYLIAYPWRSGSAPPLNSLIGAIPADADVIYLHDLALHPRAQGQGFTRIVVEMCVKQARCDGWREIALVAVNDARMFWEGMLFHVAAKPDLASKLASYGNGAVYMTREI